MDAVHRSDVGGSLYAMFRHAYSRLGMIGPTRSGEVKSRGLYEELLALVVRMRTSLAMG